jgi:hypothetical protein
MKKVRNMKRIIQNIIAVVVASIAFISCQQFKDAVNTSDVRELNAVVKVTLNLGNAPMPDVLNVKLINYAEKYEVTKTMDPNGTVTIDKIIPGIYTITITSEKNKDGFTYNYSGNLVNKEIVSTGGEFNVTVGASKSGALVMKEIFYCGSKTPTGGSYFRDQFYEIYNNSETPQNVKGLAIAILNPNTATANLPVWPGEDAANYVYATTIWQVPSDKDYIIQPGESIIIAQMADNHQKSNLNPTSPVNLLSAEFETYVSTTSIISDNPAINMFMAFWPSPVPQWLTTVFGGAFVIYFPSTPINPVDYISPIGSTSKNYKIKIDDVVDAVELVGNPNQVQLKRIPAVLDAGATTVGAIYVSKSVARKVKETKQDGRVIYYDTNNSSEDFAVMDVPMIRRNGAKAPVWNTWK